jgi:hypothetical protein
MLEQAIVDAKALREAALKNAEQAVIDKYAPEIKAAVEQLLEGDETEQEVIEENLDIPYASDPQLAEDKPVEMEMEFEFNPEDFRLDLEAVKTQAEADPESAGEKPQDTESLAADIGIATADAEEAEEDLEDLEGMLQEEVNEEDELLNELLSLLEEDEATQEEAIDESLNVDVAEVKHGHFVTDQGKRNYDAEKQLAAQESTAAKEQVEELEKEIGELKDSVIMYQDKQDQMRTVLDDMKGKLEEMILQNARLIYSNKVLSDTSLNERQKSKIVEAIAKAETLKEAKSLYQTLKETTVGAKQNGPKSLSESVIRKSVISAHLPRRKQENISEGLDFATRMRKLAGLD